MFIRGTQNVYPGLYEPLIAGLPGVSDAAMVGVPDEIGDDRIVVAVVGEPDEDLGQRIVAYVVAREGAVIDGPALSDWIAGRLSVHKRPRWVHVRASLPRNHMGKVIKPDLR
mgnify:CR=1 FL=1